MQLHSLSSVRDRELISKACSRTAYLTVLFLVGLVYSPLVKGAIPEPNGKSEAPQRSDNVDRPQMWAVLDQLATEAISQDKLFLGTTRFSISKVDGSYSYDSAPLPASSVLGPGDQYGKSLESLIRVKALRRDFGSTVPDAAFWVGPLDAAEEAIQNCLREIEASKSPAQSAESRQQCDTTVEASFRNLDEAVHAYAIGKHLQLVRWQKRDPAQGFKVSIKISPAKAHLYVMPLLEYKKCHLPGSPAQSCQWNEILDSEALMIGWYHFRADWPQDLNGTVEGDFEITDSGNLTFTPKNK